MNDDDDDDEDEDEDDDDDDDEEEEEETMSGCPECPSYVWSSSLGSGPHVPPSSFGLFLCAWPSASRVPPPSL